MRSDSPEVKSICAQVNSSSLSKYYCLVCQTSSLQTCTKSRAAQKCRPLPPSNHVGRLTHWHLPVSCFKQCCL